MKTTNIFYRALCLVLMALCSVLASGQSTTESKIIPPSPTVASLIQYADRPVSYFSGTVGIHIPIYEIVLDGYTLPISLSYNMSGIKASQESSWVGLGWSLNAGGCISRSVQCYDDFNEYNNLGKVEQGYYDADDIEDPFSLDYYAGFYENNSYGMYLKIDSEPDIFYYSFPGHSGKFLLDKSRGAVLLDKASGIRVQVKPENYGKYFVLNTPDGTEYTFSTKETAYLYSKSASLHNNSPHATVWDNDELDYLDLPQKHTSTWFLTKIVTPTRREIQFSYEQEEYRAPAQESCVNHNLLSYEGNITDCNIGSGQEYKVSKGVYSTWRLKSVSWDGGSIVFVASEREDVYSAPDSPKKLDAVRVYDMNGNLCKGYDFSYHYLNGNRTGTFAYVFKRLCLDSLADISDSSNRYTFSYHAGILPAKNTKNTDYWGYPNGATYGNKYYSMIRNGNVRYDGAYKTSNLSACLAGTLSSIQHPTGGVEEFIYELNSFSAVGTPLEERYESVSRKVSLYNKNQYDEFPSLTAADTLQFTLTQETRITLDGYWENYGGYEDMDYSFLSDIVVIRRQGFPSSVFRRSLPTDIYEDSYCYLEYGVTLTAGTYIMEFLSPPKDCFMEWTLEYDQYTPVTVMEGGGLRIARIKGGGRIRDFEYGLGTLLVNPAISYLNTKCCGNNGAYHCCYNYLDQLSESSIPLSSFRDGYIVGYPTVTEKEGTSKTVYYYHCQSEEPVSDNPYIPTLPDYMSGLQTGVRYYRGSTLLKAEEMEYTHAGSRLVSAFNYYPYSDGPDSYHYPVEWYVCEQKSDRWYDRIANETMDELTYNENLFLKSTTRTLDGKIYETRITYPSDYTDTLSVKMVADHRINLPVEQLELVDGKVVSAQKICYKDTLGMYLPDALLKLDAVFPLGDNVYGAAYKEETRYDRYNQYGLLLQKREHDMPVTYLWSYKGTYPVAEIKNATYNEVSSALASHGMTETQLCGKDSLSDTDVDILKSLRSALPHAKVTVYTYLPLVGVSSITDPKGYTVYYEYNSSGQLEETYYLEGTTKRVLQHYNYNYANQ